MSDGTLQGPKEPLLIKSADIISQIVVDAVMEILDDDAGDTPSEDSASKYLTMPGWGCCEMASSVIASDKAGQGRCKGRLGLDNLGKVTCAGA